MIDYRHGDYEVVVKESPSVDWHEVCLNPDKWHKKTTVSMAYYLVRKESFKQKKGKDVG